MNGWDGIYGTVIRSWPDIDPEIEYSESTPRYKDFGNLEPFIGPQRARPTVTAWEGADLDAYYLEDGGKWKWVHCQTGEVWEWKPRTLDDATRAILDAVTDAIRLKASR